MEKFALVVGRVWLIQRLWKVGKRGREEAEFGAEGRQIGEVVDKWKRKELGEPRGSEGMRGESGGGRL